MGAFFHLSRKMVAQQFGVGETKFKQVCRRKGITQWPCRRLQAILKAIDEIQQISSQSKDPASAEACQCEIRALRAKIALIRSSPNLKIPELHQVLAIAKSNAACAAYAQPNPNGGGGIYVHTHTQPVPPAGLMLLQPEQLQVSSAGALQCFTH